MQVAQRGQDLDQERQRLVDRQRVGLAAAGEARRKRLPSSGRDRLGATARQTALNSFAVSGMMRDYARLFS